MNTNLRSFERDYVDAVVERVLPFGVFVRLTDGTPGYIRRRELDLDADVDPLAVVRKGQKIWAVILESEQEQTHVELSRRATLRDPWPEFARRFHEGGMIRGMVRALQSNGVFVRVQAGVSGLVPLDEIATWHVNKPEEVLWVGDAVEASIVDLDATDKRLILSIKARMMHRDSLKTTERSLAPSVNQLAVATRGNFDRSITAADRDHVGAILVVDDHNEVRTSLTLWLRHRGFTAFDADSLHREARLFAAVFSRAR